MTHKARGWETLDRAKLAIVVYPDDVSEHGAAGAILLQQIRHWSAHPRNENPGWFTGKAEELAHLTGLTPKQVRTAMSNLVDSGAVEREQLGLRNWERCYSYRVDESPLLPELPDREVQRARSVNSRRDRSGTSSLLEDEVKDELPPNPPPGGTIEGGGALFDESVGRPKERSRRRRAVAPLDQMAEAQFERWWSRYPKRSGKDAARRAWSSYMADGGSVTELDARLTNYLESLRCYREIWQRETTVLNASTFVNSRSEDWADGPVSPVDLWPAPPGESWPKWIADQQFYEQQAPEVASVWFRSLVSPMGGSR